MTLLDYARALFTAEEFDRITESGAFGQRRVVLIEGELAEMPAQGEAHVAAFTRATVVFNRLQGRGYTVRYAAPLRVNRFSQPEPDVAIVRDSGDAAPGERPTRAELVVEISQSTLDDDRGVMRQLYASSGTPEYWIVNLRERQVEVHRDPDPADRTYRSTQIVRPGERLKSRIEALGEIDPAELLP